MLDPALLAPGYFVDSDHPEGIACAREVVGDETSARGKAALPFRPGP